ncbi:MAG: putative structural protein [Prokaryotic dsDNA virus sp.]|nr:MAG: putative structural protein [Prokaryotic dsDNA virus sp.]|tara:strand:+ start:12793 stop:13749 length:957 start_codon:yes stop_codon:yes gene_type:complete
MSIINSVRETVLSVLNKNNYGYITPSDFNLYAKQAQLDIFEDYFYQYNYQVNQENLRKSGIGLADIKKRYEEVIDLFSVTAGLYNQVDNTYSVPSIATTGSDYYLLNKVLVFNEVLDEGTTTGVSGGQNRIIDANADFIDISVGDIVAIENNGVQYLKVVTVVNSTTLQVSPNLTGPVGTKYSIYKKGTIFNEAEKVTHTKITMLNNSILTSPNSSYPAYTTENVSLDVFPEGINAIGRVKCQYIRYPKDPKWTYVQLVGGEPSFDSSSALYQDFEIPLEDEPTLVNKILQYAGMSIREAQVTQFATGLDTIETQKEK